MKPLPLLAVLALLAGCAPPPAAAPDPAPQPAAPAPDAARVAAELRRATQPPSPRQVAFGWELDEAGARFRGRGVARYQAPDRFRLDLFGPRGETYLAAALVDETARVPAALAQRFRLPSPALLWAAVGVVRPPAAARLVDAATSGEVVTVRYAVDGDLLEYRARGGRLLGLRRSTGGGVAESIDLTWNDAGRQTRAQYRDWAAFRTLNLTLESSTDVAAFPEETWSPPGT